MTLREMFLGQRVLALPLTIAVFCVGANGQVQRTAPSSLAGAADYLWQTVLTTCVVNGETHRFYDTPDPKFVDEFAGTWTKLFEHPLTDADRRNGIQLQGLALLGGTSWRVYERS